jgi:ABC-type amino acid transport substrate-binding protein
MTSLAIRPLLLACIAAGPVAAQEAPAGQPADGPIEAATPAECAADTDSIRIGVRNDARPFSYKLEGTRRSDSRLPRPGGSYYDGYVARICGNVMAEVQRQGVTTFEVCPVEDPTKRFEDLESGKIDILCDPSTITDPRLEKLMSSPPIYLSGITVATNTIFPDVFPCGPLIGVVGGTTSDQYGIAEILRAGEFPKLEAEIRAALANNAPRPECLKAADEPGGAAACREDPIYLGPSHDDVARRFCNHEIAYYVGDIEIVKANLDAIPNCDYKGASMTYTDERYAIFGHVPDKGPPAKLTGILEFFRELSQQALNQDSVLISSYNSTFPDATPSVKLKALYWSLTGVYPVRE